MWKQCTSGQRQKSHVASQFNYLDLWNAIVPLITSLASCDASAGINDVTWSKSPVVPHIDHIYLRNTMVPSMLLLASCDADTGTNGITWLEKSCYTSFQLSLPKECNGTIDDTVSVLWGWSMVSHNQESHVVPPFDSCDLRNTMVPLMTMLVSCNTNTGANGISWPKKSCCTSFQSYLPKEFNGPVNDAVGIMWCWHWHQWHHMTRKVMLHLISVVFT